jgi:hypothetical protein
MKVSFSSLGIALLLLVLSGGVAWAQSTAQLSGRVTDQSGAVLPGVEITATQTATGIARNTITNETGNYILPNLPIGPYRLEASLPGFRTFVQTGIVLQVGGNPTVNVVLEVGQVSETIEVQANAALVETRNVGIGQIIESQRILELPLDGRQATQLILLAGGAVQTTLDSPHRNPRGSVVMRVAGASGGTTLYTLDGNLHVDPHALNNLPIPFPDALQEFKVETNAVSPSNGMFSGAWVNAVTKSGTNEFHGSLFEFLRNDLFNARNYFAERHGTLKRNQFGGVIGGPIARNKLFFFAGIQRETIRTDPADQVQFIPNAQMLAGDFTTVMSTQCRPTQLNLAAPFVNNRIDPARFSPAVMKIVGRSDFPKTSDPCGRVTFGMRTLSNNNQLVSRVDYKMSDKHSLFGRFMLDTLYQPTAYELGEKSNLLQTQRGGEGFDNFVYAYSAGATSPLSPSTVNSFRISTNRNIIRRTIPDFFVPSDVGSTVYAYNANTPGWRNIFWTITGAFSIGARTGPVTTQTYQVSDEVSYVRGQHQLSAGLSLSHWRNYVRANAYSPGNYTSNGQVSGSAVADFLLGELSTFRQSPPNTQDTSQTHIGAFVADTWQTTPKLTLTYGVRWEPRLQRVVRDGVRGYFSEERFKAGLPSTIFKNSPYGMVYPGEPGFTNATCRPSGICKVKGMKDRWWTFAPRLGFAWDPAGDGHLAIRASYGIAYDVLSGGAQLTSLPWPWQPEVVINFPRGRFDNPWLDYPGGSPFPTPPVTNFTTDVPYREGYTHAMNNPDSQSETKHMWNFGVQKQFGRDWMAEASYIGNRSLHLWTEREYNPVIYVPGSSSRANMEQRRLYRVYGPNRGPVLGSVRYVSPTDAASYHGMLLRAERRATRGVSVSVNYTWSHCTGTAYGNFRFAGPVGSGLYDPFNREIERGDCEADRRHIFNSTLVAETPQFANPTLRAVATGWRVAGIYRKSSGAPLLMLTSGLDPLFIGTNARPVQILQNPYGDKSSLTNYLNPRAFTQPANGSYGNMGPGNIQGPGTWQFDMALSRAFRVRETQRVEVRAEAFNVTNSLRPGDPGTNLNVNTFGRITTSRDPRIMQFALKYVF